MTEQDLLLRQVHPSFVQQGRVTSQAFRPTPKDEQRLSVYDGNLIAPQTAWHHYTDTLGQSSVGIQAVSRAECAELALRVFLDPIPFPEHVLIDFSGCTRNQIETRAKQLRRKAEARGWLFLEQSGLPSAPPERSA